MSVAANIFMLRFDAIPRRVMIGFTCPTDEILVRHFNDPYLAEFEVRLAEMAQLPVLCTIAILISNQRFYDASWALNFDLLLEQLILIFPISVARFPPESKLAPINK